MSDTFVGPEAKWGSPGSSHRASKRQNRQCSQRTANCKHQRLLGDSGNRYSHTHVTHRRLSGQCDNATAEQKKHKTVRLKKRLEN